MTMRLCSAITISAILLFIVFGCSSGPGKDNKPSKFSMNKGSQALSTGIQNFEDGNYQTSAKNLQSALDQGLTFKNDAVKAHKYLAFIQCLSNREKQCRAEFKKVLEIDSKFDLEPAEAGHPTWGPVFRSVKAQRKK